MNNLKPLIKEIPLFKSCHYLIPQLPRESGIKARNVRAALATLKFFGNHLETLNICNWTAAFHTQEFWVLVWWRFFPPSLVINRDWLSTYNKSWHLLVQCHTVPGLQQVFHLWVHLAGKALLLCHSMWNFCSQRPRATVSQWSSRQWTKFSLWWVVYILSLTFFTRLPLCKYYFLWKVSITSRKWAGRGSPRNTQVNSV